MFHVSFSKKCVLLLFDKMVCSYLVDCSSWLMVLLISTRSLLIFCLLDLSICDRGVLKCPTLKVDLHFPPCSSVAHRALVLFTHVYVKNCCIFLESWPLYHYLYLSFLWRLFCIKLILFFKKKKKTYFWLCWVFIAVHGLSLVEASGGYSLVAACGLLIAMASHCKAWAVEWGLSGCGAWA